MSVCVCLSVCLSILTPLFLSVSLDSLSVCLSLSLSVCLSVCLFICLLIYTLITTVGFFLFFLFSQTGARQSTKETSQPTPRWWSPSSSGICATSGWRLSAWVPSPPPSCRPRTRPCCPPAPCSPTTSSHPCTKRARPRW